MRMNGVVAGVFLWAASAFATTVAPMSLDELALTSDLFGVVECVTAGEVVAEYKVVESWKGRKVGDVVRIRTQPNVWGPRMPAAYVGQRFVVAAYESAPSKMMSTTSGPGDPVWWRGVRTDYELPLLQGSAEVLADGTLRHSFGSATSLEEIRKATKGYHALTLEQQRLTWMSKSGVLNDFPEVARARLSQAKTLDAALSVALELDTPSASADSQYALGTLFSEVFPTELVDRVLASRAEVGPVAKRWKEVEQPEPAPPVESLRSMLKIDDRDLRLALKHLPAIDCTFVANWLVAQAPLDHERGYLLGSLVAQGCKTDRARNLELLAREAKDPFVRVACGVALLDLDKTKGEPLVRARRRAATPPRSGRSSRSHEGATQRLQPCSSLHLHTGRRAVARGIATACSRASSFCFPTRRRTRSCPSRRLARSRSNSQSRSRRSGRSMKSSSVSRTRGLRSSTRSIAIERTSPT